MSRVETKRRLNRLSVTDRYPRPYPRKPFTIPRSPRVRIAGELRPRQPNSERLGRPQHLRRRLSEHLREHRSVLDAHQRPVPDRQERPIRRRSPRPHLVLSRRNPRAKVRARLRRRELSLEQKGPFRPSHRLRRVPRHGAVYQGAVHMRAALARQQRRRRERHALDPHYLERPIFHHQVQWWVRRQRFESAVNAG